MSVVIHVLTNSGLSSLGAHVNNNMVPSGIEYTPFLLTHLLLGTNDCFLSFLQFNQNKQIYRHDGTKQCTMKRC